VHVLLQTVH